MEALANKNKEEMARALNQVKKTGENIAKAAENKVNQVVKDANAIKNRVENAVTNSVNLAKSAAEQARNGVIEAKNKITEIAKETLQKGVSDAANTIICILENCPKNDQNALSIAVNNKSKTGGNKPTQISPRVAELTGPTKPLPSANPKTDTGNTTKPKTDSEKKTVAQKPTSSDGKPKPSVTAPAVPSSPNEVIFDKLELQKKIDQRYMIRRLQDSMINEDNTLRIVVTETTDMDTYSIKLYMKGDQKQKAFYGFADNYTNGRDDCANNKIINNRLYGLPPTNANDITDKDKPQFNHIRFPICKSKISPSTTQGHFANVFTLPQGRRLDKKCLKYLGLNKDNSCIPFVKLVAKGLLNAIHIMNMGHTFYRHGNIYPHNIYLLSSNKEQIIYLDNMLADGKKYDNVSKKPFKDDFDMIGDTLLSLITGTNENIFIDPDTNKPIQVTGAADIYYAVKFYFQKRKLDINLINYDLNLIGDIFKEGKLITRAELEYKLRDTVFNFIYRLKCVGIKPSNQFIDISQALQHKFITGLDVDTEQWDSLPSDI